MDHVILGAKSDWGPFFYQKHSPPNTISFGPIDFSRELTKRIQTGTYVIRKRITHHALDGGLEMLFWRRRRCARVIVDKMLWLRRWRDNGIVSFIQLLLLLLFFVITDGKFLLLSLRNGCCIPVDVAFERLLLLPRRYEDVKIVDGLKAGKRFDRGLP